jgi:hypothetical protein
VVAQPCTDRLPVPKQYIEDRSVQSLAEEFNQIPSILKQLQDQQHSRCKNRKYNEGIETFLKE